MKLWGMGLWLYTVMVDGEKYDEFTSSTPLTWSECNDVAGYYKEGLEG